MNDTEEGDTATKVWCHEPEDSDAEVAFNIVLEKMILRKGKLESKSGNEPAGSSESGVSS